MNQRDFVYYGGPTWVACLLMAACVLSSCFGTVTPKAPKPALASFDAGLQDSGFLGWTNAPTAHSGILTASAMARYNLLAQRWGNDARFVPPVKPWDGVTMILTNRTATNYILDAEHLVDFILLSDLQRASAKP